jgi:DNA-binding CsgD family transcriptional regulator
MTAKKSLLMDKEGSSVKRNSFSYKENLLFYERIFSSLNAIVFVFDVINLRMVWTNDGFKKILGYSNSLSEIPESVLIDVYHPEDQDFLTEMRNYFNENKKGTFTAVFQFRDINMKNVWLCTACNVFRRSADDSIFEITGVTINLNNDITFEKNLLAVAREKSKESNLDIIKKLSKRELELIKYFANGYSSKEIALTFSLSLHTINNHRKSILRKLGYKNIASFVNFAIENGLN